MNPTIPLHAIGKQIGLFNLHMVNSLGEGKIGIQTCWAYIYI